MEKATNKPFKELRFTRSHQAITFIVAGIVFLCFAGGLFCLWWWRVGGLSSMWWPLLPMTAAWGCFRFAARLARHAYLLLSPIGIEIFPFFRPSQHMQLFSWGEIREARVSPDHRLLSLTMAGSEDASVFITLDPVKPAARELLAKAVSGVMEKRAAASAEAAPDPEPRPEETDEILTEKI